MSIIEKGSLILVTGVSGYIASHTALQLLEAGYNVRGTVRSEDKAKWLYELFDKKYGKGRFETVIVKDFGADDAFDQAVKGVVGVCHMASDMTFSDKVDDVIPAVVRGATSIVKSASRESGIKSLVYTSSSTAALLPKPDQVIRIEKGTWDDEAVEAAYKPGADGFTIYGASKTEAERAVWKAVKDHNVKFQVAAVLPNFNVGPIIKPGGENSSSTASMALRLFNGDESAFDGFAPQYHVDVRDTARLHVIALTDPECNGERIFAFGDSFNRTDLLNIFKKLFPDRKFPEERKEGRDLSQIPTDDAEALLEKHYGKGFSSLEESLEAVTAGYR